MPTKTSVTGSELFVVDNSDDDWKALRYLHDWCQISQRIDIATGYFEIGALLSLKDEWQKVDRIRILMGDEVSSRTKDAFARALTQITTALDESIEAEKEKNDFLAGVPAIVAALKSGKIACRVYRKEKFHAKAYITHARLEVVGSSALVGSSNFTVPGLTQNVELNVQITGRPVNVLQEWYEAHWDGAEDITPEILRVIERHVRHYSPYEVYAKSLQQLFAGYQQTVTDWESGKGARSSVMFPKPVDKKRLKDWQTNHVEFVGHIDREPTLFDDPDSEDDVHLVPPEMLDDVELLDASKYNIPQMLLECYSDLNQIAEFLKEAARFQPSHDDKLQTLIKLLKTDPVLKRHKVLIFSEFKDTAQYLKAQLVEAGIDGVEEIDSGTTADRGALIRRFSPYYNGTTPADLARHGKEEIRVLISTDVLSEGLNLQDATRLINYDLHWNPVRLMQRIGRVDRRMSPAIEERIKADFPGKGDRGDIRGDVAYWNFLPPDELNRLLTLFSKVAHKTLRISQTFGIEGKKLLTPDDDYQALKDFNEAYEGHETPLESLHLEYQKLLKADPALAARLDEFPQRVFSGRRHVTPGTQAVFFCYARPGPGEAGVWSESTGDVVWYLYTLADEKVREAPTDLSVDAMANFIRSTIDTERVAAIPEPTLAAARKAVEKHIRNTYLKSAQAPIGVKPVLKAWMELN